MREKLTPEERAHLKAHGIQTDCDKRVQADWVLSTKSMSGKPACWDCYFALKKLGYIEE